MRIKVKLFAILRERVGKSEVFQEISDGTTIRDLWGVLQGEYAGLSAIDIKLLYAVNSDYVEANYVLQDGDEVVFIPPVSGGC